MLSVESAPVGAAVETKAATMAAASSSFMLAIGQQTIESLFRSGMQQDLMHFCPDLLRCDAHPPMRGY
jgi:hypothetical protein